MKLKTLDSIIWLYVINPLCKAWQITWFDFMLLCVDWSHVPINLFVSLTMWIIHPIAELCSSFLHLLHYNMNNSSNCFIMFLVPTYITFGTTHLDEIVWVGARSWWADILLSIIFLAHLQFVVNANELPIGVRNLT